MKCTSVTKSLMGLSVRCRKKVKQAYLASGGAYGYLNEDRRGLLVEAIWSIEEPLEHSINERGGLISEGALGGKQVLALRAARNALYDDLGHNEDPSGARRA